MKILLDECVTKHLKPHLPEFEVATVREMQWSGIKNGQLMSLCVENGFDVLLTIDKSLAKQQNLNLYPLTIAVLNCFSSTVDELVTFVPAFKTQAPTFEKRKAYVINK